MNIHRNPLCGRNFEYFSEDPLLTGRYAAMIAERMTNKGVYCTLKHFAVNSQEVNRKGENEILSERALREIYLRAFEIAVKSGYVKSIMTSYNLINGFSAGACYDLTTTILRDEWGYDSFVMTDWWTSILDRRNDTVSNYNTAVMVKAQNDIYMCDADAILRKDDLQAAFDEGYLTLGELQRCAKNLLKFAMSTLAFRSGRVNDIENLASYTERVFDIDLATVPAFEHELPEKRYQVIPRKKIEPAVEHEGFYCAELAYVIDGDSLVQHTYKVYLDGNEPMRIVCSGTDGKEEKIRFKILSFNSTFEILTSESASFEKAILLKSLF
jgi:beta-glucosidase